MTLVIQSDGNTVKITSSSGKRLKVTQTASAPCVPVQRYVPPKIAPGNKPCFICNQDKWKHEFEASTQDSELDPLHVFYQTIVEDYQVSCQSCGSKTVLGLIGYTGAGKSTLLNILANRKVLVFEDSMGNLSLDVPDPIQGSEVSDGMASMTSLPNYYVQDFILCDFPGFGDNRGGQMQLLQYLIMQHVIANRPHKFILVKSALTKRDQGFIDLANLAFISQDNTIAVVSHASIKAPRTIDRYTDFQVTKQIPVVPLLAPYFHSETFDVVAHDYELWSRQFIQKLDALTSFEGDIDIPHTGEIFRYISLWKSRIVKDVQQTIDSILVQQLPNVILEPHNFDFLLSIWDQKVSLGQCIQNLLDARLLKEVPIDLRKMERSWNLFNRFSPEESDVGTINNKWSHESAEIILAFRSRIEKAKNQPTYDLLDFDRYLDEWMKYFRSHLLSYSAVKVKALVLAKGKEESDKKELSRLCGWRMTEISEIQGRFTQVLKLSKLIIKNDEVFSDNADESSRYFALGLVDDLFLQELLVWTTFRVENLKAFEESIEQYVIRGLAAIEKIQEHVQRKDIIELVSKHKEILAHLLLALIARSNAPVGTHFWEHDLQVQTVYTTTRVFDCCKSVLFDSEAVLHCSHCNQYSHQKCSPAFYCLPCKTPNATYECKLEETEFNFTVNYSPKLLKDTEYNKLARFSMDILDTNLPYKVAVVEDSCYVSINDTRNEPAFLHNFFTDAIKPKASSKEMIGLLGAFNSKAIELYSRIWDEIPSDISRVYFCGRGIGGTIAHCLNLKSILKKQNSFSIAFGSPTPFRNGTSAYLQKNKLAGRFISVTDTQDVAPAIIKLLSIGKSSKDFDAYKNSNPTLHKIITTATFPSKFLCESIEPVGHYLVLDRDNLYETNDLAKISNLFGEVVVTDGKPLDEMDKIYFNLIE
ncbi:hypothetical protein HK103_007662 [Boothiomyces macroporosus]|uniref:Uncharacterized protein n=1 Tax=Boothiomyces macroporosus TaxID=261099 RepID=A0AAD5UC76_9FUNG|nr:hypothetical protein HK103_007662 [Boothiomyces macroporosus]